jgi:hypothetical protein
VPVRVNVCERLAPAPKTPVSKVPSSAVAECCAWPLFLQVTVSPRSTETLAGD